MIIGPVQPPTLSPQIPSDPYAFFPKPEDNKHVHTTVNWSNGEKLPISNTPEQLAEHLKMTGGKVCPCPCPPGAAWLGPKALAAASLRLGMFLSSHSSP